jgi:hypothetical protein
VNDPGSFFGELVMAALSERMPWWCRVLIIGSVVGATIWIVRSVL